MIIKLNVTPRARDAIEFAKEAARNAGQEYIGGEDLLLGLAKEGEGVAAQILMNLGVCPDTIIAAVMKLKPPRESTESPNDIVINNITRAEMDAMWARFWRAEGYKHATNGDPDNPPPWKMTSLPYAVFPVTKDAANV